jgi:hypothetical protein
MRKAFTAAAKAGSISKPDRRHKCLLHALRNTAMVASKVKPNW